MKLALKLIGFLVLTLVILVGGAIVALPHLASSDFVKDKVADLVERKTGRKLTIAGDTSFQLFPNIAVSLDNLTLSNPPEMKGAPLARVGSLRANLKLLPLLKGHTKIDSITLIKPRFNLRVNKKGRRNWTFNSLAGASGSGSGSSSSARNFTLGSVTIKDGFVHYSNADTGTDEKIKAINIGLVQKASNHAVSVKGNLRWQNEKLTITTRIDSPDDLRTGKASNVLIRLKSRLTDSRFEGLIDPTGDEPGIEGTLVSDTPSLRKLAAYFDHDLPANDGFGKLKIKAKISANKQALHFTTSQFLFDNMVINATGKVRLDIPRPHVTADLEIDSLDINPYLSGQSRNSAATGSGGATRTSKNDEIDLSGLDVLDGSFTLKANQILYQKMRLTNADLALTLKKGRADIAIHKLALYRGAATGKIVLDGKGSRNLVEASLNLKNVLAGAVLRDFADFDKFAGKGDVSFDLSTRGNSVKALKASLKGTTRLKLLNGRIEGFNLARYVSDLTGNEVPGSANSGKPTTSYDRLSAFLKIDKGIARNKDFLLTGKFFRVRAAGNINLIKETLRLRVAPRLFSGNWKFAPPLKVRGPWSKPKVSLDALAFLGGGGGVLRSVRGLLNGDKPDLGKLLQKRGLQTDEEIESYLAGKKIDTSGDQPAANDNNAADTSGNDSSGSSLDAVIGGGKKKKAVDKLIKGLFQ